MDDKVTASFQDEMIGTYEPKQEMDLPFFFEKKPYQGASGKLYPLLYADGMTDEKKDLPWRVGVLENRYLRIEVLPRIGGKVLRGWDKIGKYDFIYHNSVIKPAMIGLGGAWISGGIEFNWPQHHRPTTFMPVSSLIEEKPDGEKIIWMGEVEPFQDMQGMVGISLVPGRSFMKATVRVSNNTPFAHPFMWWSNLAVPANDDYQIVFPPDVEWVNDHDRRAVLSWPVARGIYRTARPFDYGEGTDISFVKRIKVPSSFMVSEGQSDMDFVSGYDHAKKKGIVSWGDHTVVTGKKLWSWGHGPFGEMWCSNLTDADGQYSELMTGAFTDNQPDFTWIQSGETKTFEQYWYPIREIGAVKNAGRDAALNVEKRGGSLFVGIQSTGTFPRSVFTVRNKEGVLFSVPLDLDPEKPAVFAKPWGEGWSMDSLAFELRDSRGRELVSYRQPVRGKKQPIVPREPVKRPSEIATVEDLYYNALHLEQYKQHSYDPRDYYREALSRDPLDVRCNTGMARLSLKDGRFSEAAAYAEKAEVRLLSRNSHPEDAEACYLHGLALTYLGRDGEARRWLSKSAWTFTYAGASYFQLALIELRKGVPDRALEYLAQARHLLPDDTSVAFILSAVLREKGRKEEAASLDAGLLKEFPLDPGLRWEETCIGKRKDLGIEVLNKDLLPFLFLYEEAGMKEEALALARALPSDSWMKRIYVAYFSGETLDGSGTPATEFPSHLADFLILPKVDGAMPSYLYGCLCYDRFRYDEAVAAWEKAIGLDPDLAYAYRNLAIALFDKKGDFKGAEEAMAKAYSLKPENPRILYEYQQLLKNRGASLRERLALYDAHPSVMHGRDDCVLDASVLLTQLGRYGEAEKLLENRTFHIYEGGEGKITQHHAWMHLLHAFDLVKRGDAKGARLHLEKALVIPRSYGEAKSYFAQEGHIHYFLGLLDEEDGKDGKGEFELAAEPKSAVSPLSLFRALALQKLGRWTEAEGVLTEMLAAGEGRIANADRYPYFGVGAPTPMPFEYDIRKRNIVEGSLLKAYALYGLGRPVEAEAALSPVREKDPYNFLLQAYEQVRAFLADGR